MGGPQTHVLFEAFGDHPVGPDVKIHTISERKTPTAAVALRDSKKKAPLCLCDRRFTALEDNFPVIPHVIQKQRVVWVLR